MTAMWVALAATGLFTGALTGFSGGSVFVVVVPFLTQVWHLPLRIAIGSSLGVDVVTSLLVAWGYAKSGAVRLRQAWPLFAGALAGPQLGALLSHAVSGLWLTALFVAVLVLMGINFLQHGIRNIPLMPQFPGGSAPGERAGQGLWRLLAVTGIGLGVGTVTGLIGASGGVLYLFALIYGLRMPLRPAVGTAIFIMAVSAISGAAAYIARAEIAWTPMLAIGALSMLSGYLMARYVQKIPERVQAAVMGVILLGAALWMLPQLL